MSQTQTPIRVIDDDPVLGKYIAHYTTNRLRLLTRAGIVYAVAVVVIQLLTANLEGTVAAIVIPLLYSAVGLPLGWYLLHLWNREMILFERGFTYRQGSTMAIFHYAEVKTLRVISERIAYFGFLRGDRLECHMQTEQGDHMAVTQLFGKSEVLIQRLERAFTLARRPIVTALLERGTRVPFGASLWLTQQGLEDDVANQTLRWSQVSGYRAEGARLIIVGDQGDWMTYNTPELDNLMLLLAILKDRSKAVNSAS